MSESIKPTPGPWSVCEHSWCETSIRAPSTDHALCRLDINHATEESQEADEAQMAANARLMAAAPELLEAAKLVLEWYEAEDNHSGTDFYQRMQMCRDSEDAIRAAIAKATGEQT